jgi:hypothetical protein
MHCNSLDTHISHFAAVQDWCSYVSELMPNRLFFFCFRSMLFSFINGKDTAYQKIVDGAGVGGELLGFVDEEHGADVGS